MHKDMQTLCDTAGSCKVWLPWSLHLALKQPNRRSVFPRFTGFGSSDESFLRPSHQVPERARLVLVPCFIALSRWQKHSIEDRTICEALWPQIEIIGKIMDVAKRGIVQWVKRCETYNTVCHSHHYILTSNAAWKCLEQPVQVSCGSTEKGTRLLAIHCLTWHLRSDRSVCKSLFSTQLATEHGIRLWSWVCRLNRDNDL